jgi:hypothetical protein
VHIGLTDGTVTEVIDGLSEGDPVIVDVDGGDSSTASSSTSRMPRMF